LNLPLARRSSPGPRISERKITWRVDLADREQGCGLRRG
jgi:hypothetical protein